MDYLLIKLKVLKESILNNKKNIWDNIFPYIATFLFLVLSIILITRHELWRDEARAWLIGSESKNISEFIKNMRSSEGHPYLWSFILYLISHFISDNLEIMKVVALAISTVTAFLVLKFSPFNKVFKTLIVFGYFLFYEYSIISRNYSIGILFIFLFCILFKNRHKNIIPLSITLVLIMQGSLYSFFIALALLVYTIYIFIIERDKIEKKRKNYIYIIVAIVIVISGILLEYWQLGSQATGFNIWSPNIFNFFKKEATQYLDSLKLISIAIITAFLPLSPFKINFWNSNLLVDFLLRYNPICIYIVAILLFLIPLFFIKRKVIFLYVLGFISISFIPIFLYKGFARHYGHFFILLIVCLWLSEFFPDDKFILFNKFNLNKKIFNVYFAVILSVSLLNTINAYYHDYKYQFSASKSTSEYILNNFNKNEIVVVGYRDYITEVLSGYLDKPIYYPQAMGTKLKKLINWENRYWVFSINKVIHESLNFIDDDEKLILAIAPPNLKDKNELENLFFKEIYNSNGNSIVEDENFALYIFDKKVKNIFTVNSSNYKNVLKPLNECSFSNNSNSIIIQISGNDPSFEIKFPFNLKHKLFIIKINDFISEIDGEFTIYFKRFGENYNEQDKQTVKVKKGLYNFYFAINNTSNLEQIRFDPVNIKQQCQFRSIEIIELEK